MAARDLGNDLEHQTFDSQHGTSIAQMKLTIESGAKRRQKAAVKIRRAFRQRAAAAGALQPTRLDFNPKDADLGIMKIDRMLVIWRMKDHCRRPTRPRTLPKCLCVCAFKYETEICRLMQMAGHLKTSGIDRL